MIARLIVAIVLFLAALGGEAVVFFEDDKGRVFAVLDPEEQQAIVTVHNRQVDLIRQLMGEREALSKRVRELEGQTCS